MHGSRAFNPLDDRVRGRSKSRRWRATFLTIIGLPAVQGQVGCATRDEPAVDTQPAPPDPDLAAQGKPIFRFDALQSRQEELSGRDPSCLRPRRCGPRHVHG
ncbi:MAG: hypothetical protein ACREMQ_09015 [Longimicrobiales bacterium]